MTNQIADIYDLKTPLSELRKQLGYETTENLLMVLCRHVEALEARVAQLEKEPMAYCQNCGDAPHKIVKHCCNCGEEYQEVTE